MAIENTTITPGCRWLDPIHKYNELCSSAHWLYLNQRYHRLYPQVESYVGEIEKTLYNIIVANQIGQEHIRYHAYIDIQKDGDRSTPVSCCAGLGTRVLGSLPEFVFSLVPDGLYVDLYTDAEIEWAQRGTPVKVAMQSDQPYGGVVSIRVSVPAPLEFALHVRIPAWTKGDVPVAVNGEPVGSGSAGSYLNLARVWQDGDCVTFDLPMPLRISPYQGLDSVPGFERCAVEFGPLLLGLTGPFDFMGRYTRISQSPARPEDWLTPVPGKPGHFAIAGRPGYEYMPYHEIQDQVFTCYPLFAH